MTQTDLTTLIIVNTQFEATHFWKGCDIPEVEFLKYPHRHTFNVRLKIKVFHDDRDKEFIIVKNKLNKFLEDLKPQIETEGWSCEMIARHILNDFPVSDCVYVRVMEDNENGAEIY